MAMGDIERFVEGMSFDRFKNSQETFLAVQQALVIIGESVKRLPKRIKSRYRKIRWKKFADLSDVLIKKYWDVDLEVVWEVIQRVIPSARTHIEKIIDSGIK